ncbi:hypothetical protein DERF_011022 [Dermatophagoides farinae]|uniref:MTHFR SAM-binding regulatory domain-containing protein n=2 Tax=Dermatophagoides farinae TaxID=6954 RepID=A0A922HWA3_DERFA|nr:hypothetical protein DERF_011022 [Dermatophagoides farinae]
MTQQQVKKSHMTNEYVSLNQKLIERSQSPEVSFFSTEFFPPKTWKALDNLVPLVDSFRQLGALFSSITWHSNVNHMENIDDILSIQVVDIALNYCSLDTMIHLTCVGMTANKMLAILERLKQIGIRNILALRGDLESATSNTEDFQYASDLVRFIRHHYGDYFTIAVSGYPIKHPESINKQQDREYLKNKVNAGADFIITQLFFEADVYFAFVDECRAIGINVPILPGIMPIQSYDSLSKITRLSQLDIPAQLIQDLEPIRMNDEAIRSYGIEWTIHLCRQLMKSGLTPGLHFYTLNRQYATTTIVKALEIGYTSCPHKPLPWRHAANHRRCSETVRPIFWSSRPKSYMQRTNTWDEFPNGRWGRVHSPAFGSLNEYHLFAALDSITAKNRKRYRAMWGEKLHHERDVWHIFESYVAGINNRFGHKVESLPWNDEQLAPETDALRQQLSCVNRNGILTINSQPNVNGIISSDPVHGWGSPNGYVYQKAYVEFFVSGHRIGSLLEVLSQYPLVNYQITNNQGDLFYTNLDEEEPIAVTWGVFPGKEIIQPTIVDVDSFKVWKEEAFSLWMNKWACIYPDDDVVSRSVLTLICDTYYLVNLVDNDYPNDTCLWSILDKL